MQNGTKRGIGTRRHGPAGKPFSGRFEGSEQKLSRLAGVRFTDARRSYERYMELARAAGSTGDATEIENYYQHAEHYFRLMNEQAAV
jgi:Domain of unknown function (DUF4167)